LDCPFSGRVSPLFTKQLVASGNQSAFQRVAASLFGSVFAFIGGGLIYAALRGYGLLKQQAALEEASPLSPWLWRTMGCASRGKLEREERRRPLGARSPLQPRNAAISPGHGSAVRAQQESGHIPSAWFQLIGAILIVKAARASIRRRRFGETYFEFDTLPFSTGERVRGRIHLQFDARAEHGIDLRLSCVRRVVSGSGENSTTNQIILWQSDQNVPSGALAPGPLGSASPSIFRFLPTLLSPITTTQETRFSGCSTRRRTCREWITRTISRFQSLAVPRPLR